VTRTDRLYSLVEELRAAAPRARTVAALARGLEVSERTVQRDLQALMAGGVPVRYATGRGGGWSIDPAMTLPPIRFTPAEAAALTVALAAAVDTPYAGAARSALQKVAASMTGPASEAAREVAARIVALPPRVDPAIREAVESGLADHRALRLRYVDADGRPSTRDVEPAGLLSATGQWYLVAWCRTRQAGRGFRLDRIEAATSLDERIEPRDLPALLGPLAAGALPPATLDGLTP
jgi:predicted DNA-binding transcriptional regulator YafY